MPSLAPVSLIIPAYNEASRIGNVLESAQDSKLVNDIVVVDDGSTDHTSLVAKSFGVAVVRHKENYGKGVAMETGYLHAKSVGSTALVFLDADLRGLTEDHVDSLVEPILAGQAQMTIGILERTKLQKEILSRWGALSGQRALSVERWRSIPQHFKRGFGIEAGMNISARKQGWHHEIERIELRGVTHVGKREKEPTPLKAGRAYTRTYGTALLTYAQAELQYLREMLK